MIGSGEGAEQFPGFRVPELQAAARDAGRQVAVAAECHGDRNEFVFLFMQTVTDSMNLPVPDPHRPLASRRELSSAGTERCGIGRSVLTSDVARPVEHR